MADVATKVLECEITPEEYEVRELGVRLEQALLDFARGLEKRAQKETEKRKALKRNPTSLRIGYRDYLHAGSWYPFQDSSILGRLPSGRLLRYVSAEDCQAMADQIAFGFACLPFEVPET